MNQVPEKALIVKTDQESLQSSARKVYEKPRLIRLGDLRAMTLGSSPDGYEDSGSGLYTETYP